MLGSAVRNKEATSSRISKASGPMHGARQAISLSGRALKAVCMAATAARGMLRSVPRQPQWMAAMAGTSGA